MKIKKTIYSPFVIVLTMVLTFSLNQSFSQTPSDTSKMKDCCMMKGGKMMKMESGKMMLMENEMTMKNGTVCKPNGECMTKSGQKMMLKDGECMDMNGNVEQCGMKGTNMKSEMKNNKMDNAAVYSCPMHPEIKSDKPGKCSKCGMDLELIK